MARGRRKRSTTSDKSSEDRLILKKRIKKRDDHPKRERARGSTTLPTRKRSRISGRLSRRSSTSSVEIVDEYPCASPRDLARYKVLVLDSALFLSSAKPAKRKQSHISVVTISSDSSVEGNDETGQTAQTSDENSLLSQPDEKRVQSVKTDESEPEKSTKPTTSEKPQECKESAMEILESSEENLQAKLSQGKENDEFVNDYKENVEFLHVFGKESEECLNKTSKENLSPTISSTEDTLPSPLEYCKLSKIEDENRKTHQSGPEEMIPETSPRKCTFNPISSSTPENNLTKSDKDHDPWISSSFLLCPMPTFSSISAANMNEDEFLFGFTQTLQSDDTNQSVVQETTNNALPPFSDFSDITYRTQSSEENKKRIPENDEVPLDQIQSLIDNTLPSFNDFSDITYRTQPSKENQKEIRETDEVPLDRISSLIYNALPSFNDFSDITYRTQSSDENQKEIRENDEVPLDRIPSLIYNALPSFNDFSDITYRTQSSDENQKRIPENDEVPLDQIPSSINNTLSQFNDFSDIPYRTVSSEENQKLIPENDEVSLDQIPSSSSSDEFFSSLEALSDDDYENKDSKKEGDYE